MCECGLSKKAEPPPTRDVNRDSGTASANGGWLRRLVRPHAHFTGNCLAITTPFEKTTLITSIFVSTLGGNPVNVKKYNTYFSPCGPNETEPLVPSNS